MASKDTAEYRSVLKSLSSITEHLQVNQPASESLVQKYQEHGWLSITARPGARDLVILALGRIQADAKQYAVFVSILETITGMDIIVGSLKGDCPVTHGTPSQGASSAMSGSVAASQKQVPVECRKGLLQSSRSVMKTLHVHIMPERLNTMRDVEMRPGHGQEHQSEGESINDLMDVLDAVYDVGEKWYNLGLALGLKAATLDKITADHVKNEDRKEEMLKNWLRGVDNCSSSSWNTLVAALRRRPVGHNDVADTIVSQYLK